MESRLVRKQIRQPRGKHNQGVGSIEAAYRRLAAAILVVAFRDLGKDCAGVSWLESPQAALRQAACDTDPARCAALDEIFTDQRTSAEAIRAYQRGQLTA